MRDIENAMVVDAYWRDYEPMSDEEWYARVDEAYEYEKERRAETAWIKKIEEEKEA